MLAPLLLTLEVATVATVLASLGALGVVFVTQGRASARWVDAVLTAPLVLPPTVLGYYLLLALGHRGVLGQFVERVFGAPLVFSRPALVLAATLTAMPLVLQTVRSAIDSIDPLVLDAARTLGASRWRAFHQVAVPLASRGVASGVLLGFARACGDFGVTLMLAGDLPGTTQTAALALYDAVQADRSDDARLLALALSSIAVGSVLFVHWFSRRPHAR